jgi:hypothetical protein
VSKKVLLWVVLIVLNTAGLVAMPRAHADPGETLVGLGAGLWAPGFESQNRAAPALLNWGLQLFAHYGPDFGPWSWDLSVGASLSWATYSGVSPNYTHRRGGETMTGDLYFNGALYHPEVFVQYEVLSGWDVSVYVDAALGAMWTTYSGGSLRNSASNYEVDANVGDFGHGGLTSSASIKLDWRLARAVKAGASIRYTRANSPLLRRTVSVPVTVAYYWW